jgi:hypothetical protein
MEVEKCLSLCRSGSGQWTSTFTEGRRVAGIHHPPGPGHRALDLRRCGHAGRLSVFGHLLLIPRPDEPSRHNPAEHEDKAVR